jgi:phosphate uptake regulator
MIATVTEARQAATTAFLDQNLAAAPGTASLEQELEDNRLLIKRWTLQLLASRQPVSGEPRMLLSAIKISSGCGPMGILTRHIGMATRDQEQM